MNLALGACNTITAGRFRLLHFLSQRTLTGNQRSDNLLNVWEMATTAGYFTGSVSKSATRVDIF
jgi:hypothetical protein